MGRYTGAVCRLCRREGEKLFLKGDRCYTVKCAIDRRNYVPGIHGQSRRKLSEYGVQLREKQKAKRIYGVMERQFRRYYSLAARKKGVTGEILLQFLESRLDNVLYRLGIASSRAEARQMVNHGLITVNGRKVDIASFRTKPGDEVTVKDGARSMPRMKNLVEGGLYRSAPSWLEVNQEQLKGRVLRLPERGEIDVNVKEHLITELYSK